MNRKDSKRKSRHECAGLLVNTSGNCKGRQRCRRRMTCPSEAEINKAKAMMAMPQLTKGCSVTELIDKCIQCFDLDGCLCRSNHIVNMTLMMHCWVMASAEFARRLLALYREALEEKQPTVCLKICHFVRYWITQYPAAFKSDSKLEEAMSDFWEVVKKEGDESHCQLIDTSSVHSHEWTRKLTYTATPNYNKKRKVSLLFDHLEPSELADHLSYLEFKAFCRITYLDYRNYVVRSAIRENPALERSVALCNGISQWVQLMILSRPTPQQRAEVFTKFIHVMQKLRQIQNFSTLMAIIGGVCHSAISRLKETKYHLSQDVVKTLNEMTELVSSNSNYSNYRRIYSECTGFKIPIVGVHLKDLVSVYEALPDYLEDNKMNLSKLQTLYNLVSELTQLQQATPPFEANKDLIHLLSLSLDLYYTEDQIYELSYSREAKTTKTLPATIPCKPPLVAEWVSAIEQKPDPLTFSKHFQQMVDFWCVSKQGYRCQDCGMNCHGQCKDHMSSEYKRRLKQSHSFALGSRSALPITPGSKNSSTGSEEDGFTFPRGDSTEHENGGKETTTVRLGSSDHPQINSKCLTIDAATQTESSCLDNDSNWTWTDSKMAGQDTKHQDQQYLVNDSLIEEEQKQADSRQLLQRIKELEEERDSLLIKNADLCSTNAQLEAENAHLQGQISIMHEDLEALNNRPESFSHSSVSFILQKMDSFHLQQDS